MNQITEIRVEAPDRQIAEVQQVEQTSGDETNSVEEMELENDEIKQVKQNSEADPVKGNELTTKRGTKPPLNFLAILNDANIPIDTSFPDQLCKQLYDGVFLEPNALKYYVDEKLNKNCFKVFAKKLSISWIENNQYWEWIKVKEKDTSGEVIEVANLLGVCWLNIEGKIRTIDLSPGTQYEVVFVVMMNDGYQYTWKNSVTLTIILPSSKILTRSENLSGKEVGNWIDVKVGEFKMTPENVGEITFKLGEYSSVWKAGLVLKCAIIRPKYDEALE